MEILFKRYCHKKCQGNKQILELIIKIFNHLLQTIILFKFLIQMFSILVNIIIYYSLMKFVLSFLILLLFSANSAPYDTTFNFILNPDFSFPNHGSDLSIIEKAGAWFETANQIQIGNVKVYNSRWTSGQLCELDANQNSNIYQTINLNAGNYELRITWAARQGQPLDTSKFSVYLDDDLLQFFTPTDYNIHTNAINLIINTKASYNLYLRGEGPSDSNGAGIKLVELYAQNYVNNGCFNNPDQRKGWSVLESAGQWSSYTDEIEIGLGPIYNSVWNTGQITELDANSNTQIYQIVSIPAGKYYFRFDWAARSGIPLGSNAFSVYWNDVRIRLVTATDYLLHTFAAEIQITYPPTSKNILKLRGEGISDGYGIGVDNVRIWRVV